MTVTAVVLNWRTPELSLQAARALIDDGIAADRVVVADNGSGDGSVELLREGLPGSLTVDLRENLGFAAGNNRAAAALPATEAYLFVNSDAIVHGGPGATGRLLAALDDPAIGVAVPRLRNRDLTLQPSVYPLSTPLPELVRAAGLSRWVPERFAPSLGAHWDHGRTRSIQCAVGAVLAVRAVTWDELGGFDERRFMYAEDLDLFWRLARLGWRAQFVAESEFVHYGGASSAQRWDNPSRAARVAAAEAEMLRAQLGPIRSRITLATMAAGVGARSLAYRVLGNSAAAATQRAWFDGYLGRAGDSAGE